MMKKIVMCWLVILSCALIGGVSGYLGSRVVPVASSPRGATISLTPPQTAVPYLRLDNNQWLQWGSHVGGTVSGFKVSTTDVIEVGSELWALYGMIPAYKGSDPCGTGFPEGAVFWNMSSHYPCYCDHNGDDLKISDDSACF